MYALYVTIHVKPINTQEFLAATREHARLARQEPGNARYDLLQSEDDATCFVLYEAYRTKQDFLFHRQTAHALKWKEQVEPWMACPRERIRGTSIISGDM